MPDLLARLQSALHRGYAVEREIGHGGMATVYLARDLKHDRAVALKVLRPELAMAVGPERFLREIKIAARLQHPHILPLHDSGYVGGFLYYVMPYVAGASLRDRLQRDGPLPVEEAVRLAREVAGALEYAHVQGIVHRDVKPENILLQAGHAIVTDFGIARAVSEAGWSHLTRTGVAVGTPLYMSPEQAAGDAIDGRSDVYSLGCMLYEMVLGRPPYARSSSLAVLASHSVDPVPSLREHRADVPVSLEQTVTRAMAKLPAERFASAAALDAALASGAPGPALAFRGRRHRWTGGIVVLAVSVALVVTKYALTTRRHGPAEKSIAVLPLVNQSGVQEDQIRSDGMTEALIDALARVPGLRVASRMSVFAYQHAALDSREIGARLHAAAMLEGSFQRAGTVLQVSVRLVNADDGYVLWSDTFRRDQRDVFAVQDEISQAVVRALQLRLADDRRPLVRQGTKNLEAYDLYLKGRWFWNQRGAGPAPLRRSIGFFQQAISLDSNYAGAWAGLADDYSMLPAFGDSPPADAYPEAKRAAQRALALDSTLADAYTSLGIIRVFHEWDWTGAARAFDQALALDPTEPRTHLFHAWYYVAQGQLGEALREVRTAQQLNPLSPIINARVGSVLYYLHRYDEAAAELRQALELDSSNINARAELGRVLVQQRRFPEALAALPEAVDVQAGYLGGARGYAYGRAGHREEALAVERRLRQRARERYIDPVAFATVAIGLGDTARALDWLVRGRGQRSFYLPFVAADPIYEPLRRNARFLQLVLAIGLQVPRDSTR
ncbi:MAG TPA: protein kinase [Gemmatimonadales bacterium]|nr:protein kinase [Gemmatimonadales bacterium]